MNIETLIISITALLCLQITHVWTAREKSKGCKSGKCKFKINDRLRILRDLSQTFYPGTKLVDIKLKSLHNRNLDGQFGTLHKDDTMGYEVPKFVCGPSDDNTELLACPTPDSLGRIHCIDFYSLCDHKIHCPNGEDEDSTMCLFHTATHQYMDKMMTMISRMNRETQETLQTVLAKVQPREPSYLNYNIQK